MKILMVLTSQDKLGDYGLKTVKDRFLVKRICFAIQKMQKKNLFIISL